MFGLFFEATWRRRLCFHPVIFFFLAAAAPPTVDGYFLGDIKAVVNGCEDHWALRDRISIPSLSQMTVCVNIRVVVPGPWVAFSYSSVRTPNPNLALEGDDKTIYGWLLQVQHRFPFKMSPMEWHRVCLRRDVRRNIFSLEVDHVMVAERTVIAQAIPPSGSLWLGCHQRNRSPGGAVGKVELYLFRMWADLGEHRSCEDGTVTGWDGDHWDVTSPNAKETDHSLPCDHKRLRRDANPSNATASSVDSVITSGAGSSRVFPAETGSSDITSPAAVRTTTPDKSPANQVALSTSVHPITALPAERSTTAGLFTSGTLVTCNISQLCSNKNAYYWIPMSVKSEQSNKTEQDLSNLVSEAFDCKNTSNEGGFGHFCKANGQLQVMEVTCRAKAAATESQTLCNVLLLLSHAVSPCDLQHVLQRARGALQANITGNVERVGRTLCEDGLPSSGDFVRCTSTSSLDEICRSNRTSDISCSVLETNSVEAPQQTPNSCSGTVPRFCNCSAFCETERQLYAIKIKITSNMTVIHLRDLLLKSNILSVCTPNLQGENCSDIVTKHTGTHLECYGEINRRFYSCMVVLEMSGPVNSCSLSKLVKLLIDKEEFITTDGSLSRMMVCGGAPDLSGPALLASNLKWSKADLLPSDVCQPGSTLIKCEANETLAVLLADSCPPVPQTTSPTQTNSLTSPTSVTHTTANAEQKQLTWSPNTSFTPPNNSTMHNLTSAAESSKNATVHSEISTNQTVFTTASLSETKNYNGSTTGPIHKQTTATTTSLVTSTKTTTKSPPSYAPVPSTSVLQSNETRTYSATSSTKTTTKSPPSYVPSTSVLPSNETRTYGTTTSTKTTTELHPSYATVPSTSVLPSSETRTYSATSSTKTATKSPPSYVPSTSVFTSNETRTYGATSSTKTTTKSPPSYVPSTSLLPSNETRTYGTISSTKTTTESHPSYATVPSTSFLPSSETKTYDTSTVTPSTSRLAVSNVTTLNVFTSSGAKNNDGNTANNESTKSNIAANTTSNTSPPSLTNIQNVTSPTHPPVKLENVTTETNTLLTAVVSDYTKPYATPSNDQTTAYNARTPDRAEHHVATPSNNSTIIHYDTTPSKKYTTELKLTNPNNTTDNSTITSSNSHTTENINHTTDSNATAPGNNYTAEFNATKHNNQTAIQNATTPTNHYTTPSNSTTLTDNQATVDDSTIPSNNHTTLYATIKLNNNYPTIHNPTTPSNNHTTLYATINPNNNCTTIHNPTTPSNNHTTLFGTIKPNNNYTTIHNPTTPSNNNTTPSNPTSNNNTALYNATTLTEHQTTLDNPTTLSNNNTAFYKATTLTEHQTTLDNPTTLSNNNTELYNPITPS
ncbi:mucin-5AC-like, partial [Poecilia formosa]|uniref:mucin-5AC-like n=1 Tax=Poecilia formosa TaxID=48698 RepID=UPI0007B9D09A